MTRDPERIDEVLEELEEYWKEHPDLRLGQLIMNMAYRDGRRDCFYLEDDTLVEEIREAKNNDN